MSSFRNGRLTVAGQSRIDRRRAGADVVCKRCLVGGRVQGVFYRATTARRALELAIRGYARNLEDGRDEVLAYGDAVAVELFVEWLWTGSTASKVTSVDVIELSIGDVTIPTSFYTA